MSVIRDKRWPSYWHYDFQIRGRRFYGTTKRKTRAEAEAVEQTVRETALLTIPKPTPTLRSRQLPHRDRRSPSKSESPSVPPQALGPDRLQQQHHHHTEANGHDDDGHEHKPQQ
jgi:hypothetical protein